MKPEDWMGETTAKLSHTITLSYSFPYLSLPFRDHKSPSEEKPLWLRLLMRIKIAEGPGLLTYLQNI